MRKIIPLFFAASLFAADFPMVPFEGNQKIAFQNAILCKVNGNTISMLDVKKRMDVLFHQNYSHLEDSTQARYQFYESSWRQILSEMIDQELILSDAEDKEIKITEGEVREELESRFGPSVMVTLDKLDLTYEEAWKMIKNEMIVRRMTWWFIHAKALNRVTPQEIRAAYRSHIKQNPPYKEFKYQIISLRGENPEESGKKIYELLAKLKVGPSAALEQLKEIDPTVQVSSEYRAKDHELSEPHKTVLATLTAGEYSNPIVQMSRSEKRAIGRIFCLREVQKFPAPKFEEISQILQNELTQKAVTEESLVYLEKLRKHYGFNRDKLKETLPEDLHPFSLE